MVMVLNTIHGLKVFDIIYSLTGGGPGTYSEVINTQVFREFGSGRYGMANALSVLVFLVTLVISVVMKKALIGEENEEKTTDRKNIKNANSGSRQSDYPSSTLFHRD